MNAVNANDIQFETGKDEDCIKLTEGICEGMSGVKIYRRSWTPVTNAPRALLFISHGYCEHSGRYDKFARILCSELECLVLSHDHVGHGKSEGERVMVETFDVFVNDVFQHIDEVRKSHPELPVYIFGHSMGGTIAILAACKRPEYFHGIVLTAPAIILDPDIAPGRIKIFIGNILNHFVPSMEILPPIDHSVISSDTEQVKAYTDDPLIWHGGAKIRFVKSFGDAFSQVKSLIPSINWPFFVAHGECDKLTYIAGTRLLEKEAKSKDKEMKIYKGLKHEILNETKKEADQVMFDIVEWLKKRITKT